MLTFFQLSFGAPLKVVLAPVALHIFEAELTSPEALASRVPRVVESAEAREAQLATRDF